MRPAKSDDLIFLTSTLLMVAPRYCYNLTVSGSFRVCLLFAWRRLCQDHGTWAQLETLVYINSHTVTKKSLEPGPD